jgi:hypothetical protein
LRIGHEGRSTLLATSDEFNLTLILVKAIQHSQVAFAWHTKSVRHALGDQTFDQKMAANLIGIVGIIQTDTGIAHTASLVEGRMILSKLSERIAWGEL